LRLYLPDGEWPLRVEDAHITGAYRASFTVQFTLPARDHERVRQFLAPDYAFEQGYAASMAEHALFFHE
jgi:hypothetical protein